MSESQRVGPWVVSLTKQSDGFHIDAFYNGKPDADLSDVFKDEYIARTYYQHVIQRANLEAVLKG